LDCLINSETIGESQGLSISRKDDSPESSFSTVTSPERQKEKKLMFAAAQSIILSKEGFQIFLRWHRIPGEMGSLEGLGLPSFPFEICK